VTVTIDDRCTACGMCLVTCPERALLPRPKRPLVVDALCTGCLACVEVCPRDAVTEAGPSALRSGRVAGSVGVARTVGSVGAVGAVGMAP